METVIQPFTRWLGNQVRALRASTLARNAGWMLVGQGFNLVFQGGYFILLARLLGVSEADYITASYAELFFRWKERTGSVALNMTFDECDTPRS